MWNYSDKLKDHFFNPRNVGEIKDPDGIGEVGSIACGDALKLMISVNKEGVITEAKFQTFGCGSAIASASALTEMIKGKTVEEASKITNKDIADFLGGMPEEKMHCSVMGREALSEAIANYKGLETSTAEKDKFEVVCHCFGVTDREIRRVIKENNLKSVKEITHYTKAGGGCGKCVDKIQVLLDEVLQTELNANMEKKKENYKNMTTIQKIKAIEDIINKEIRPLLQQDGGDIELIDLEGNVIKVSPRGVCASCPSIHFTLRELVQKKLHEFLSDDLLVEEVKL